jgi:hypothetical protein
MNPELIQTMRAALEAVMDKIPADQSVFGVKAAMAEVILKALRTATRLLIAWWRLRPTRFRRLSRC